MLPKKWHVLLTETCQIISILKCHGYCLASSILIRFHNWYSYSAHEREKIEFPKASCIEFYIHIIMSDVIKHLEEHFAIFLPSEMLVHDVRICTFVLFHCLLLRTFHNKKGDAENLFSIYGKHNRISVYCIEMLLRQNN